jgi:phosphomannomutase/phosphoglucomutase
MLKTPVHLIPKHIFRAYDIRGIADVELSIEVVHDIGMVLGSMALEKGETDIVVARDGRLSGPHLLSALENGIQATGCNVINVGMVPTPVLYFAIQHLGLKSGVMLTGSHNPAEYNGIKMVIGGATLSDADIQQIYQRLQARQVKQGKGGLKHQEIESAYIDTITKQIQLKRGLKVVVDAGNGVTGNIAPKLMKQLGCEVIPLFCEVDGTFPNHHPDPSKPKNLADLIAAVAKHQADVGIAFDGDGDRLGVVTPKGKIIYPDRQLMLFAKHVLKDKPGATILFDVKCSKHVAEVVKAAGGVPLMWKTGHSLIKTKMKEIKAAFAGEMSGHIFFNDKWFGFDDGLYSAARLLAILDQEMGSLDEVFDAIPDSISTPEINVSIPDSEKFIAVQKLIDAAKFKDAKLITIDGLRAEFADGWFLVRASNTTPCLVVRVEADSQESLKRIHALCRDYLRDVVNLNLPA